MYVLGAKDTEVRETESNPWPQYNEILMIIEFLSLPQNKACIRRHFLYIILKVSMKNILWWSMCHNAKLLTLKSQYNVTDDTLCF